MALTSGWYVITNVRFKNVVTLLNDNQDTDIVSGTQNDVPDALVRFSFFLGGWMDNQQCLT